MWCLMKIPVRLGGHAVRFPGDLRRVRSGGAQRRTVSKLLPAAAAIASAVSPSLAESMIRAD
jgi:hypothetical protein